HDEDFIWSACERGGDARDEDGKVLRLIKRWDDEGDLGRVHVHTLSATGSGAREEADGALKDLLAGGAGIGQRFALQVFQVGLAEAAAELVEVEIDVASPRLVEGFE